MRIQLPRRRPEEIFIRLRLSSNIKALIVEGPTDKQFFEKRVEKRNNAEFYSIDEFDLSGYEALSFGGARGRCIKFAEHASQQSIENILVVIDRDTDELTEIRAETANCQYHDHNQLNWYPLTEEVVLNHLQAICRNNDVRKIANHIFQASKFVTAVRVYRDKNCRSRSLPKIDRGTFQADGSLDKEKYIQGCSTTLAIDEASLTIAVNAFERAKWSDYRSALHFGDFVDVYFNSLRASGYLPTGQTKRSIEENFRTSLFTLPPLPDVRLQSIASFLTQV